MTIEKNCFIRKLQFIHYQIMVLFIVFEVLLSTLNFRETTRTDHRKNLHICCYIGHSRVYQKLMTLLKTVKLQTKKTHQIKTATLIPPSKNSSNSNLDIFSTHCFLNSETEFIICQNSEALLFSYFYRNASFLNPLIVHIIERLIFSKSSLALPPSEIKYPHVYPVLSNHENY